MRPRSRPQSASRRSRSMLPLKGKGEAVSPASSTTRSRASPPVVLDVGARRVEVAVVRDDGSRPDGNLEQDALGGASLVGGNDVPVTRQVADHPIEAMEGARACVGLVGDHHRAPLGRAHRGRAGVGQEVERDLVRRQPEQVVVGLTEPELPLGPARQGDRLDDFDPERLDDDRHRSPPRGLQIARLAPRSGGRTGYHRRRRSGRPAGRRGIRDGGRGTREVSR